MSLTSHPIVNTVMGKMHRYLSHDWYTKTAISLTVGHLEYESLENGSATGEDNKIVLISNTLNRCWDNRFCLGSGYMFRYLDSDLSGQYTSMGNTGYDRENFLHLFQ